ncbi:outer membrane protein assembly factor BamD [Leptolyngbya sp. 15MV]|nr:outer membrane protein assembly factor BamD [Leptolyngbya sp. 15MV]
METLYSTAKERLDRGNPQLAAALFDEVERQHPYSPWARRAQLMSAFSYYVARDYNKSIASSQRFLSIHPGNKDAPYAYYLIALSYYEQISDVNRDQGITLQARTALNEVVRRFPQSQYASDARLKLDLVNDHLAGKEMEIGRFYARAGMWLAAQLRFQNVVNDYQTTSHAPEALYRLAEANLALGVPQEAVKYAAVLGANYPGNEWYQKAYQLVQRHAPGVTASFEFATLPAALAEALDDAGVEIEPGEPLLIRRQLKADGGSKAFVNDQPVGVALLREIAPALVELHGQHDDRGLANPRGHRLLLDRFAGADTAGVAAAWDRWRSAEERLAAARSGIEQAKADQDLLLAHLAELAALEPQAGEEARLAETRAAMQKGERLSGDLAELRHLWEGSDSPLAALRIAARRLDRIAPEHPLLGEALGALDRAVIEAGEAEDRLAAAAEALVHDPAALEAAETRLFDLRALARKHRCEVDELPGKMRDFRAALDKIEGGEAELDALELAGVMATVISQLHAGAPSAVATVQPSSNSIVSPEPGVTTGSMVNTIPRRTMKSCPPPSPSPPGA